MSLTIQALTTVLNHRTILQGIDFELKKGEYLALLGPSGSGKTTLLKSLAGLIPIQEGRLLLEGQAIDQLAPNQRPIAVVFQDLRLFPHLDVYDNLAFPMRLKGLKAAEINQAVQSLLADVQLIGYEHYAIRQLSGGQQQRIALARSLAYDPQVLLLDEPFSGLDEPLRREMGALVYRLVKAKGISTILVTHDKREAVEYADRVAFLYQGQIQQLASPTDLLNQPASRYLAKFLGKLNELPVDVDLEGRAHYQGQPLAIQTDLSPGPAYLCFRPSQASLQLATDSARDSSPLKWQAPVTLDRVVRYPEYQELQVQLPDLKQSLWVHDSTLQDLSIQPGQVLVLSVSLSDCLILRG